ncbi:hypothetical protein [Ornithinimicrobium pekingense]|uniref:DNA-directed RNA polymerase specialized sigma24 family protein n=1 Tax=Ornithinimicrobium pekingense TaxID=384677 RepID=A0ABQ2F7G9_9MICO|nr:hypothetical protein [Ornithinimicrobium pekingense]GGK66327.1 hypothetical protein GCM10011509_13270 [Ornithinimicrobium pekingense]
MTTTSGAGASASALVPAHGAGLHRLAAVLTADTEQATGLVARTLAVEGARGGAVGTADPRSATEDRLRRTLVRLYLRSAPRRTDGVRVTGGDAGDVLASLRPRDRAATALRLLEGWDEERTAAAVGVPVRRVSGLVPRVPGLELALAGLADQHALTGADLETALDGRLADELTRTAPSGGRLRTWAVAAGVAVAVLGGYAVTDRPDGGSPADAAGVDGAGTVRAGTDLTEAGWRLDDEGAPPRSPMGLHLRETVVLDDGRRSATVDLPSSSGLGFASFGVLWCDMPPAQDAHLRVPSGTISLGDAEVDLPCAGREGSPPVTQVVALPLDGVGVLRLDGDIPGRGGAVLGVYAESDHGQAPAARGSQADPPPVDAGSHVLDVSQSHPSAFGGRRLAQATVVGHDSTVRVWAGRTGALSVLVDGVPVTDDGDVASMTAMIEDLSAAQLEGSEPVLTDPRDYGSWTTQQPDLRDGRWLVPAPGQVRTFELPQQVRPAPGERRTVAVEVVTENIGDLWQVALSGAAAGELDTGPVAAVAEPSAPRHALGHRLVGQWQVPSDGQVHELLPDDPLVAEELVVMVTREVDPHRWYGWGEGLASLGERPVTLWLQDGVEAAVRELRHPWFEPVTGPGPLTVAAPASPGHPPATVLAYAPVPYEEFDFATAGIPPGARPAGAEPELDPHSRWPDLLGWQVQAVVDLDDLEDGHVTVPVTHGVAVAARVTSEGKGRVRFLVEGQPADALYGSEGWWSSWTAEAVTSELELSYSGGYTRPEIDITLEVEGYEDLTVELLTQ